MKRIGMILMTVMCLSASAFAAGNQPITGKWEPHINAAKLSKYLSLDSKQTETVGTICEYFNEQMAKASHTKGDKRKEALHDAVFGNLKLMKKTLTEQQYGHYLRLLNVTLQNKGITIE